MFSLYQHSDISSYPPVLDALGQRNPKTAFHSIPIQFISASIQGTFEDHALFQSPFLHIHCVLSTLRDVSNSSSCRSLIASACLLRRKQSSALWSFEMNIQTLLKSNLLFNFTYSAHLSNEFLATSLEFERGIKNKRVWLPRDNAYLTCARETGLAHMCSDQIRVQGATVNLGEGVGNLDLWAIVQNIGRGGVICRVPFAMLQQMSVKDLHLQEADKKDQRGGGCPQGKRELPCLHHLRGGSLGTRDKSLHFKKN